MLEEIRKANEKKQQHKKTTNAHNDNKGKRNKYRKGLVLDEMSKDNEKKYKHDKTTKAHNDNKEKKQIQERVSVIRN